MVIFAWWQVVVLVVLSIAFGFAASQMATAFLDRRDQKRVGAYLAEWDEENESFTLEPIPEGLKKYQFGHPVMREYHPDEFESAMLCPSCERELVAGEEYWEIPLPEIDGVITVCMPCASKPFSTLFADES